MAEPYFLRGYAKLMLEDYHGAQSDASEALKRNAFLGQAYLVRAISEQTLKNYAAAEKDYSKALSLSPDEVGIRYNLAGTLYELKEYHKADSLAATIPEQKQLYANSLLLRGSIAIQQSDTLKAEQFVRKALQADSTSPQAYAFYADLLRFRNKEDSALLAYDKAITYAPDEAPLYINRGLMRSQRSNYNGAIEDYNKAIQLSPNNELAFFNRALLRSFVGDLNNAVTDFKQVLRFQPNNYMAIYNLALLYSKLGQEKQAVSAFDKVLTRYPNFMIGYIARSEAKRRMGDAAGADRDLYKAEQLQRAGGKQKPKSTGKKSDTSHQKDEEEDMLAYDRLVADNSHTYSTSATLTESLRGRVQDIKTVVAPLSYYRLTFFLPQKELTHNKYDRLISQYNEKYSAYYATLLATCQTTSLDSLQLKEADAKLMDLSEHVNASASYYFTRAMYKYAVVDIDGALADLYQSISLNPKFLLSRFMVATLLLQNMDLKQADVNGNAEQANNTPELHVMGEQVASGGNNKRPLYHTPLQNKGYDEIIKQLNIVLKEAPDMAIAQYNRAIVAERMGNKEEAVAYYTAAIKLPNAPNEAYYNRGLLLLSLGKKQEAIADFSRAGELGIYQAYNILKRIQ